MCGTVPFATRRRRCRPACPAARNGRLVGFEWEVGGDVEVWAWTGAAACRNC